MTYIIQNSIENELELLKKFNNRESLAFGEVYLLYHKELNLYTSSLYRGTTIASEDVIHDIFINIWQSDIKFEKLINIKAYMYISIKNGFKNHIAHNTHVSTYKKHIETESNFLIDMTEAELYSFIRETLDDLPIKYKEVLMLYIKGWRSGEIALHLGRTKQNVYNIKNEGIKILKKRSDKYLIILMLLK